MYHLKRTEDEAKMLKMKQTQVGGLLKWGVPPKSSIKKKDVSIVKHPAIEAHNSALFHHHFQWGNHLPVLLQAILQPLHLKWSAF